MASIPSFDLLEVEKNKALQEGSFLEQKKDGGEQKNGHGVWKIREAEKNVHARGSIALGPLKLSQPTSWKTESLKRKSKIYEAQARMRWRELVNDTVSHIYSLSSKSPYTDSLVTNSEFIPRTWTGLGKMRK